MGESGKSHHHVRRFASRARADRARWIVALRDHKGTDVSTPMTGRSMRLFTEGAGPENRRLLRGQVALVIRTLQ